MKKLKFSRDWTNKKDFATYEESEEQVRQDLQLLHDETRDALNALMDELTARGGAAQLGAAAPAGLAGGTVQALIDELAAAISSLAGELAVDGSTLAALVAAALEERVLTGYYNSEAVDKLVSGLNVTGLEQRMSAMENALSADGVAVGEVVREYPFTTLGAELAGAESRVGSVRGSCVFEGDRLFALVPGDGTVTLGVVDTAAGEARSLALVGDSLSPAALEYRTILWTDGAGRAMLLSASSVYYLINIDNGACSRLCTGGDYSFRGAVRQGDEVRILFARGDRLELMSRDLSGERITAGDTATLSGSGYDTLLDAWGDALLLLRYGAEDLKLELYRAGSSSSFSTGCTGTIHANSVRRGNGEVWCILWQSDGYRLLHCRMTGTADAPVPSIRQSEPLPYMRLAARGDGVLYGVHERNLYRIDSESLILLDTLTLPAYPADTLTSLGWSVLRELWGGRWMPLGSFLLEPETGKLRQLRAMGGEIPDGYPVLPAPERCFALQCRGRWVLFDTLLRPVWGMVPYIPVTEV